MQVFLRLEQFCDCVKEFFVSFVYNKKGISVSRYTFFINCGFKIIS